MSGLSENEKEAFIKITELIGEMSFGVGVPIDMPEGSYIIFDAIYHNLKNNQEYQPMESARSKELHLIKIIEGLDTTIIDLKKKLRSKE